MGVAGVADFSGKIRTTGPLDRTEAAEFIEIYFIFFTFENGRESERKVGGGERLGKLN